MGTAGQEIGNQINKDVIWFVLPGTSIHSWLSQDLEFSRSHVFFLLPSNLLIPVTYKKLLPSPVNFLAKSSVLLCLLWVLWKKFIHWYPRQKLILKIIKIIHSVFAMYFQIIFIQLLNITLLKIFNFVITYVYNTFVYLWSAILLFGDFFFYFCSKDHRN